MLQTINIMKHITTILFISLVVLVGTAQKRISLDINYRQNSYNISLGYHQVVFKKWLISGTVFAGKKGRYFSNESLPQYDVNTTSESISSPWLELHQSFDSEVGTHNLKSFTAYNKAIGTQT